MKKPEGTFKVEKKDKKEEQAEGRDQVIG